MELEKKVKLENMIYEVRGKQVMLDSDIAKLFEVTTGNLNKAMKRNMRRFPEDFCFQLTNVEYENLIFQIGISSSEYGGRRTMPYVYTEQGVAMLTSVIHSDVAVKMSVLIMNAFVVMKKYINMNLLEQKYINNQVMKNTEDIKLLQESFSKFEEKRKSSEIYFKGQIYDAYSKIYEIFNEAREELIIIDNYADNTILDIVKRVKTKVTIITRRNNLLTIQDIQKYNRQYDNLRVKYDNGFHDRYFVLDGEKVYHCGASVNRIGYKTFSINSIEDVLVVEGLLKRVKNILA